MINAKSIQIYNLLKQNFKKHRWFWIIIASGTIIRIALNSAVDSFDFYAFVMWAKYLSVHRMADVFEFLPEGYTPYPPLYYYVLKGLGFFISVLGAWENKWLTYLIVRTPMIAADILVSHLIYRFTKKYISQKSALIGSAFYFLHPAIIYNTSIWGQIDSVVTLMGLLSVNSFIEKKPFWGIGIYLLGVITKLQILALLPLILFLSITSAKLKSLFKYLMFWISAITLPFLPIIFAKGFKWTWDYFFTIPNWYAYTSVYTYNLWAPFGFIVSDNTKLFGLLEYKYIGIFLFWLVAFFILKPLFNTKNRTPLAIVFAGFLLWYDFSFFATRIHSRYLIYSFGFLAPLIYKYPLLSILVTILMFANFILPLKTSFLTPISNLLNQPAVVRIFVIYGFGVYILAYKKYRQMLLKKIDFKAEHRQ